MSVPPAPRPLNEYAWRVLGVREFVINLIINAPIAYLVYRPADRVPLVGWFSLLVICGPMSCILPFLTTFFGYFNGVLARSAGRAGQVWPPNTRWKGRALQASLLTAGMVAPLTILSFVTVDHLLPGLSLPRNLAVVFVALFGGVLGYFLHARAVIQVHDLGSEKSTTS